MKEWYYIASDEPNTRRYFDSYDDTQFAILCIFRYSASFNMIPDYYVYHNDELVEIASSDMLLQIYLENGGEICEEYFDEDSEIIKKYKANKELKELSKTLQECTQGLKELMSKIEVLNNIIFEYEDGDKDER